MRSCILLGASVLASACTGYVDLPTPQAPEAGPVVPGPQQEAPLDPVEGPARPPASTCEASPIAPPPIRRISAEQFRGFLLSQFGPVLGPELATLSTFPETRGEKGLFRNDAQLNVVSSAEAEQIHQNAQDLAESLLLSAEASYPRLNPCLPSPFTDADLDRCLSAFLDDFGGRAFRRALRASERATVTRIFTELSTSQGGREAFSAVLQYFLSAPAVLYRPEAGEGAADGRVTLTSAELASRLGFLFLDGPPDAELLRAAQEGRLSSVDGLRAEAQRLMRRPEFQRTLTSFHHDWLQVWRLPASPKTDPIVTSAVVSDLELELERFLAERWAAGDRTFQRLMSSPDLPTTEATSPLYRHSGAGPVPNRKGLLTLASVMAAHARGDVSNPLERGAFLTEHVLCQVMPLFPGNIDRTLLNDASDMPTARQRLQPLMENETCAGCHVAFQPIGLSFEAFDGVGRFRESENGAIIDTSVDLSSSDVTGRYPDLDALLDALAVSEDAARCYALHWLHFALGAEPSNKRSCDVTRVQDAFVNSGGQIEDLLLSIVSSDAFRFRAN